MVFDDSMLESFQREHKGDTFLYVDNSQTHKILPQANHHTTFLRTKMFSSSEEIWHYLASYIIQLRIIIFQINMKMTDVELQAKLKEIS